MAAAASACAGDRDPDTVKPADPGAVGTAGTPAAKADTDRTAARSDRDFVGEMMADGRAEVELGKLARQKAQSKEVKDFAAMMVREHTKAGAELKTVATQANIEVAAADAGMDDHKDVRDRLAKLSGREFDREYIKAMVDDHEKAVKDAEAKADAADSDHVKQWAAKALPTLKKHLEMARDIDDALGKRSGT
jgi:putative membrane protein